MKNVLITGGTGLIGQYLSKLLIQKGYKVSILSTDKKKISSEDDCNPCIFYWDIERKYIDEKAIIKADYIIHLAGANIGTRRWTSKRKKEILKSRVDSSQLLYNYLKNTENKVKAIVAASAIGIYGIASSNILTETSPIGNDFLATVTHQWEQTTHQFRNLSKRTVQFRIGVVLSSVGGVLPALLKSFLFRIGIIIGKGDQWISWIHIEDVCHLFIKALEDDQMNDIYNAAAPEPVRFKDFLKQAAYVMNKKIFFIHLPFFFFRILLGERANLLISSLYVSPEKTERTGFEFKWRFLQKTLSNLLG